MSLGNLTYGVLIDQVKTWIKSNCINISAYGTLPACFKSGYSNVVAQSGNYTCTVVTIGDTVSEVLSSVVDSDMLSFWANYCGNLSVGLQVAPTNYIAFIQDMICFCSERVYIAASQFSQTNYLVYSSGEKSYSSHKVLSSTQQSYKLIMVDDVAYLNDNSKGILTGIINDVSKNIRLQCVRYDLNITKNS